jgi:hypothetical protein
VDTWEDEEKDEMSAINPDLTHVFRRIAGEKIS